MSKETIFSRMPALLNLMLLFGLMIIGMFVSVMLVYFVQVDKSLINLNGDLNNSESVSLLKIMQLLNHSLIFIFPALIFGFLMSKNPFSYLKLNTKLHFKNIIFCFIIVFLSLPLIGVMVEFNKNITMPSFLSGIEKWMRESEEQAFLVTEAFLDVYSIKNYLFNILVIAIIPAIGEELIFRGVLQRVIIEWINKPLLAILITSFIFSVVHLQFYGFIPRMFLGFILGYLFFYTGNLWVAILLHLINNAFTVTAVFLKNRELINIEAFEENMSESWIIVLVCFFILFWVLWYIKKPATELNQ